MNIDSIGLIYFLQNGDPTKVKIGFTTRTVNKRIRQLQTGTPIKLTEALNSICGKKSQESELHGLLDNFKIFSGGDEWFVLCDESRAIIESFRQRLMVDKISPLPLFDHFLATDSRYEKYDLLPRWPIEELLEPCSEWPECKYLIKMPNNRSLLAKTMKEAQQVRLEYQYMAKYGHPAGYGFACWLPDDIRP